MAIGNRKILTNDRGGVQAKKTYLHFEATGDLTADVDHSQGVPVTGTITAVVVGARQRGIDATDTLTTTLNVLKNAVNPLTTDPILAQLAGGGAASTAAAGTGITLAVLKTDTTIDVVPGDTINVRFNETSTTPDTEISDVWAYVEITELQDFDPAL